MIIFANKYWKKSYILAFDSIGILYSDPDSTFFQIRTLVLSVVKLILHSEHIFSLIYSA